MSEEWREVPGYDGLYSVSSDGMVRNILTGTILSPGRTSRGYLQVAIFRDRVKWQPCVHKLVALAFIPNPDSKPEVNHIDGNKLNNSVGNLEWVTSSENRLHAFRIGLSKSGENHPMAKMTLAGVLDMRRLRGEGWSYDRLAYKFGTCRSNVANIIHRRTWSTA